MSHRLFGAIPGPLQESKEQNCADRDIVFNCDVVVPRQRLSMNVLAHQRKALGQTVVCTKDARFVLMDQIAGIGAGGWTARDITDRPEALLVAGKLELRDSVAHSEFQLLELIGKLSVAAVGRSLVSARRGRRKIQAGGADALAAVPVHHTLEAGHVHFDTRVYRGSMDFVGYTGGIVVGDAESGPRRANARRTRLLRDAVDPHLSAQCIALRISPRVRELQLPLRGVMRGVGAIVERLKRADGGREAIETLGGIRDLRFPVGVNVAQADAAKTGVAGREVRRGGAHAEQSHVIEDRALAEQADIAAQFHRAPACVAERQEYLTSVDAGG